VASGEKRRVMRCDETLREKKRVTAAENYTSTDFVSCNSKENGILL
jgi:hypothetical protein